MPCNVFLSAAQMKWSSSTFLNNYCSICLRACYTQQCLVQRFMQCWNKIVRQVAGECASFNSIFSCVMHSINSSSYSSSHAILSLFHTSFFLNFTLKQFFVSVLLLTSNVQFQKNPYCLHRRVSNFLGGGGFCKAKKFKEMYMYEA